MRNDRKKRKGRFIPRKNKNLRHLRLLERQSARFRAVSRRTGQELAKTRQRLAARASVQRQASLARLEAQQKAKQTQAPGLSYAEQMKRDRLRESVTERVRVFLQSLQNQLPPPERERVNINFWNAYIEGLNLEPGDLARYHNDPPDKAALVERLFAAALAEAA